MTSSIINNRKAWRLLALVLLAAVILAVFTQVALPAGAETNTENAVEVGQQFAAVGYTFTSVEQARVRYKSQWGRSPEVSCTGGVQLPSGQVIVTAGVDIPGNRFVMWLYPSETLIAFPYPNIINETPPPGGWNSDKDRFDPTKACALIHQQNDGSYRIKLMFTSYTRNNDWLLALMDTGIVISATP